jgi:hypothetical protein
LEFLLPQSFFGLLAIPLLFLLNLYRHRRLKITVSSLIIWSRIQPKIDVSRSSRRKYVNLSLLLQIGVLLCLVFALASPTVKAVQPLARHIHLVFDVSASMDALSDENTSRIERAKLQAKRLLDSLTRYDRVRVSTVPPAAAITSSEEMSPQQASEIVDSLSASAVFADTQAQVEQIVSEAKRRDAAVFVFTDKLPGQPPAQTHFICCGGPGDDCAITQFSVKRLPKASPLYEAFIAVSNFSVREVRTVVKLTDSSEKLLAQSAVSLPVNSKKELFFTVPLDGAKSGILKAEIDSRDQLEVDNYAYATQFSRKEIHVALLGKEDENVIKALSQYPGIQITRVKELEGSAQFDLVILNEYSPSVIPAGNYLIIAPPKEIPGVLATGGEIEVKSQNPIATGGLFTDVSVMREIRIAKAKRTIFADSRNFETLLEAQTEEGAVPLIGILRRDRARIVYVAFPLSQSNWQRQVSFPLFFAFLLESLSGQAAAKEGFFTFRTGEVVPIAAKDLVQIRTPSGKILPVGKEPGLFYPLELTEAGVYEIERTDSTDRLGASLLSEEESDISGVTVDFDPDSLRQTEKREERVTHLYQYFLLLAGLLMIADWMTSRSRRTV